MSFSSFGNRRSNGGSFQWTALILQLASLLKCFSGPGRSRGPLSNGVLTIFYYFCLCKILHSPLARKMAVSRGERLLFFFFPRMPDLACGSAHSKRRVKGSRQLWRWAGVRAATRLWLHEPVFKVKRWVFLFLTDATLHTLLVCIVLFCTYYYYYYFVFFFFWILSDRAAFFYDTSWLFLTLEKKSLL